MSLAMAVICSTKLGQHLDQQQLLAIGASDGPGPRFSA